MTGTLAITLTHVFFRQNKESINEYAEKNFFSKVSSQNIAAAMQSNDAYQNLLTMLPPYLADDLGLYVGARWGRISKALMIVFIVSYVGVVILLAKFAP